MSSKTTGVVVVFVPRCISSGAGRDDLLWLACICKGQSGPPCPGWSGPTTSPTMTPVLEGKQGDMRQAPHRRPRGDS
jgi:hypothetical protein